jgi:protein involved in polysaccharide export with SLBB domain
LIVGRELGKLAGTEQGSSGDGTAASSNTVDKADHRPMTDFGTPNNWAPPATRRHLQLLAASLAILCVVIAAAAARAVEAPAYKLGSGDKLRVTVYEEKSLSGDYEVSDQGTMAMPLIGSVRVGGLTVSQAETLLTQRFNKYLVDPRVGIEVLNYRPFFILGEVKKPGSYPYVSGMSVLNAVSLAGGFTPRADEHDISIKRASDPSAKPQRVDEDAPVLPGDILRVHQRLF